MNVVKCDVRQCLGLLEFEVSIRMIVSSGFTTYLFVLSPEYIF